MKKKQTWKDMKLFEQAAHPQIKNGFRKVEINFKIT